MFNLLLTLSLLVTNQISESNLVRKIYVQGNHTFKTKTLVKILSIRTDRPLYEIELEKDVDNLTTLYELYGFEQVEIKTEITQTPKGKQVYFIITEGPRTKINSITIQGVESFSLTKIRSLIKLRQNEYLVRNKIDQAKKTIEQFYKNSGYPYVTVEGKTYREQNLTQIFFNISEGRLAFINELRVRGNQKVSEKVILTTTEIKKGERFSLARLEKARQRLYASQLFERVSFYILESTTPESLNVRFDVIELPARSIGLGFGFQTPPTGLLLSTEWQHLNFLSRRHNLFLSESYTPTFRGDWQSETKSSYRIYYFFNTPVNFILQPSFKYEKVDSLKQNQLNIETGISRYIGPKFEVGTFLRYLQVWSNYSLTSTSDYRRITNSQNLFIRLDTRDKIFTPSSGIFFATNVQYAGGIFDGDNDFYKNQTEFICFYQLQSQLVIAVRTLSGFAVPYGRSGSVPYYETFSLGGNNGLRGYNDKSIGPTIIGEKYRYGEAIVNANFELRTHFEKLIDIVIFVDAGKVTDDSDLFLFNQAILNYSAGLGIRINTPFGPIRVDYAKRLKDAPADDWGKFHLGLLNLF